MTPQMEADLLLKSHQASREARMRLAGLREHQLSEYYEAERRKGVDSLTATERLSEHAKFLDRNYESDLEVLRECLAREA